MRKEKTEIDKNGLVSAYDRLLQSLGRDRERAIEHCPKPEWIRLPQPRERCPWTQLSRSGLIDNVVEPALAKRIPVRVLKLIQPGANRGIRLIHFDDLMTYLNTVAAAPVAPFVDENEE